MAKRKLTKTEKVKRARKQIASAKKLLKKLVPKKPKAPKTDRKPLKPNEEIRYRGIKGALTKKPVKGRAYVLEIWNKKTKKFTGRVRNKVSRRSNLPVPRFTSKKQQQFFGVPRKTVTGRIRGRKSVFEFTLYSNAPIKQQIPWEFIKAVRDRIKIEGQVAILFECRTDKGDFTTDTVYLDDHKATASYFDHIFTTLIVTKMYASNIRMSPKKETRYKNKNYVKKMHVKASFLRVK